MNSPRSTIKIKPKDVPFETMTEAEVDSLVESPALAAIDPEFRRKGLRSILQTHARRVILNDGDIVIREGDWGNTAFFLESGSVVVITEPPGKGLPPEDLGRRGSKRKSLLGALAQIWNHRLFPEFRDRRRYEASNRVGRRGEGSRTRVFLRDFPGVLEKYRSDEMRAPGDDPNPSGAADIVVFGELAALGRTARVATVIAQGDTSLIEMRWQGLRNLKRQYPPFDELIERTFKRRALAEFLRNSPILDHFKKDSFDELLAAVRLETYGEYDQVGSYKEMAARGARDALVDEKLIAREGDEHTRVVLVRNGLARVSHAHYNGHRTVNYLGPGQVFGFDELLNGRRREGESESKGGRRYEHSLRAIGFLTTVEIPTSVVERHLLDVPGTRTANMSQDALEFLVEGRFVNGTRTMLIDLDRCTRCDDCVRACAATHDNNPRFVRQGRIHDGMMVANACMHCYDPVCMIECPTGAISRRSEDGLVVINDLTCVGCSTCARNCPYDAIRMVEIRDRDGSFLRDPGKPDTVLKATKCDLCVEQSGGPACQRACPHDALVRIDMQATDELARWQNR